MITKENVLIFVPSRGFVGTEPGNLQNQRYRTFNKLNVYKF